MVRTLRPSSSKCRTSRGASYRLLPIGCGSNLTGSRKDHWGWEWRSELSRGRQADSPGAAERSAFSGLCIVFIQATKQAGTVQLVASADDLASAMVLIQNNAIEGRLFVD